MKTVGNHHSINIDTGRADILCYTSQNLKGFSKLHLKNFIQDLRKTE